MKILLIILISLTFTHSFAAEKLGIKFPDVETVNGTKLVLNGLGIRKATWIRLKVYIAALYLQKKSQNINDIINPLPRKLVMHFVMDLSAKKLIKGWNEGFTNVFKGQEAELKKLRPAIDKFNSYMQDIEKGQKIVLIFDKKGLQTRVNGKEKPLIADPEFTKALISVWFVNPKDENLRDKLQGK